jgi:3-keto-disaccharide hydrolase
MVLLFDGKSLDNFEVLNGTAPYEIVDDMIVGTTLEGSPNTFLSTKREYGDFILEFDVLVDPELNSGVQIRSHQYAEDASVMTMGDGGPYEAKHEAGRVYGLQVEISNEEAGASGGVYDEARRGWVDNIQDDPVASKALKDNEWNHYRIEAVGDSVKTFINGVPCADLVDATDLSGLIGFQVHQYEGDTPKQVRWKNIWIKDLGQHVWEPIWDGSTLAGWSPIGDGKWEIVDGAIKGTNTRSGKGGFLASDAEYDNFTVHCQLKLVEGDSGFYFRFAQGEDGKVTSGEMQINADGIGGYFEVGGRNWVVKPTPEDLARYYLPGEWNDVTISAQPERLVIRMNGQEAVDLVEKPIRTTGKLALQAYGDQSTEIWFKDLAILSKQ